MIRIEVSGHSEVAASFVRLGADTQAAAYRITKEHGVLMKRRVLAQASGASARYRSSITLRTSGANGNPRAVVSRSFVRRRASMARPGFLQNALNQTGPEYVAAIAAIPMSLDR